jgi:hypothetical protein
MCLAASSRSTSWRQRELCVSFPAQSRSRAVHAAVDPQLQPDLGQVGASVEWVGELCAADIELQRELAAEGALCELPSTAQESCARSCGRCAGWGKWERSWRAHRKGEVRPGHRAHASTLPRRAAGCLLAAEERNAPRRAHRRVAAEERNAPRRAHRRAALKSC